MYYKDDLTRNGEGYGDMTAYLAIQRIEQEALEARRMKRGGRKVKHNNRKEYPCEKYEKRDRR